MKPLFLDAKDPEEIITISFDFTTALGADTLTGVPTVTVAVYSGTDAAPGTVLNGAATLDVTATKVLQSVKAGVANVDYRIKAKAVTAGGRTLAVARILPVRNA